MLLVIKVLNKSNLYAFAGIFIYPFNYFSVGIFKLRISTKKIQRLICSLTGVF